jgi:hypothetical protein
MVVNEAYIGNLVSGKSGTVSYKNQRKIKKEADNWIRVEATHPVIIPHELWERVQTLSRKRYKPGRRKDNEKSLFAGLLHCKDCGFRLRSQVERRTRKDGSVHKRVSYMCSTYGRSGKNACTIHNISENTLVELVADPIRAHAGMVTFDEGRITQAVLSEQGKLSYRGSYQNEMDAHAKQIEKIDMLIENICADKAAGLIPDSLYKRQTAKYERERTERTTAMDVLKKRINIIQPLSDNTSLLTDLIKQFIDFNKTDTEVLNLLIDKIIVHEAQIFNEKRVCDVEVFYNYEDL